MNELHHRSRSHAMRGQNLMAAADVSGLPELQPMLLRLGLAVGDVNAGYINRVEIVKSVAAVIVKARAAR